MTNEFERSISFLALIGNKSSIIRIPLYYFIPLSKLGFNEVVGIRMLRFSYSSNIETCIIAYYAYHNFQNKSIKIPSNASTKFVVLTTFFVVVDACKDLIMANDATTSSNPLAALIQNE